MGPLIGDPLPEWSVQRWFSRENDLRLRDLRGRVVVLETFQMLCPGCVSHGLPLASKIFESFSGDEVAVVGLHTVFEHHEAMGPGALAAFLHEYRIPFPVGVDRPTALGVPETMQRYGLRGTPSLLLVDQEGRLQARHFGAVSELAIGAQIGSLLRKDVPAEGGVAGSFGSCGADGCT